MSKVPSLRLTTVLTDQYQNSSLLDTSDDSEEVMNPYISACNIHYHLKSTVLTTTDTDKLKYYNKIYMLRQKLANREIQLHLTDEDLIMLNRQEGVVEIRLVPYEPIEKKEILTRSEPNLIIHKTNITTTTTTNKTNKINKNTTVPKDTHLSSASPRSQSYSPCRSRTPTARSPIRTFSNITTSPQSSPTSNSSTSQSMSPISPHSSSPHSSSPLSLSSPQSSPHSSSHSPTRSSTASPKCKSHRISINKNTSIRRADSSIRRSKTVGNNDANPIKTKMILISNQLHTCYYDDQTSKYDLFEMKIEDGKLYCRGMLNDQVNCHNLIKNSYKIKNVVYYDCIKCDVIYKMPVDLNEALYVCQENQSLSVCEFLSTLKDILHTFTFD